MNSGVWFSGIINIFKWNVDDLGIIIIPQFAKCHHTLISFGLTLLESYLSHYLHWTLSAIQIKKRYDMTLPGKILQIPSILGQLRVESDQQCVFTIHQFTRHLKLGAIAFALLLKKSWK